MNLIDELTRKIKNAPKGNIRIAKSHKCNQYYHIIKRGDTNGKYILKKDFKIVRGIIQRNYEEKFLKELKYEIVVLKKFDKKYNPEKLENMQFKFKKNRQKYIKPIFLDDDEVSKCFQEVPYEKNRKYDENLIFSTTKGDTVRSKSEVLIAETLYKNKIPYRYEWPLSLKNENKSTVIFHPDFYCFNVNTRKEYVWEHFGKLDEEKYLLEVVKKLNLYLMNGYFPGKNLIITVETLGTPLTLKIIEKNIKEYLQ